jgi:hypothetical protein
MKESIPAWLAQKYSALSEDGDNISEDCGLEDVLDGEEIM